MLNIINNLPTPSPIRIEIFDKNIYLKNIFSLPSFEVKKSLKHS